MSDPKLSAGELPLGGPGFELVEKAREAIDRYRMLATDEAVLVAVSGGPDSTCLLDVLRRLASKLDISIVGVAHVDHGLAEKSEEVAARVSTFAADAGLDVHVVRAPDLEGPNLQARAREFRYGFFETIARNTGAGKIATGHTLDDRVETTLARLLHGAGTEGLAGIPPTEGVRIRPLISCRRAETRAYCRRRDLEFDDDPANEDQRFERAAVRHRLVESIEAHWGEGAVEAIASSAERLREDAGALDALAERLFSELAKSTDEKISFERRAFAAIPNALRRRLLQLAVGRVRDRAGGIDAALVALDSPDFSQGRFAVASGAEIIITKEAIHLERVTPLP
ncbi:MAG: tRNA lysidine(34) synthetase TilS [Actinomycetota bacterium]|nr:tRNA lysidine(34) synthetase TilS [Actinomycetota bacterium]